MFNLKPHVGAFLFFRIKKMEIQRDELYRNVCAVRRAAATQARDRGGKPIVAHAVILSVLDALGILHETDVHGANPSPAQVREAKARAAAANGALLPFRNGVSSLNAITTLVAVLTTGNAEEGFSTLLT